MEKLYIIFEVRGQEIKRVDSYQLYSGSKNFVCAKFLFDKHWANVTRFASIANSETTYTVEIVNGECLVPWECLAEAGTFTVSVFGGDLITANKVTVTVLESGLAEGELPDEPTPGYFQQIVDEVKASEDAAKLSEDNAKISEENAEGHALAALLSEQKAKISEDNAKDSEDAAKESEINADTSEKSAAQILADLIAMIDRIPTLDEYGKILSTYLPHIAITGFKVVTSVAAMLALTTDEVQQGDIVKVVESGEVIGLYGLEGDDPSILANWVELKAGYAAEAAHAVHADTSADSERINGHRLIAMTESQYQAAINAGTIDENTIYLVGV